MNKKLLFFVMPFFMACGYAIKNKNMPSQLLVLLQEQKYDSLAIVGKNYKWFGNHPDTSLIQYINDNESMVDSLKKAQDHKGLTEIEKENIIKAKHVFLSNIIAHEAILSKDTTMHLALLNNLYERAVNSFEMKYKPQVVADYEKCELYYKKWDVLDKSDLFFINRDLGIQYNILGEKEKAISYYLKAINFYDTVTHLSDKRVNKIASAVINLFSLYSEYKLYDSIIKEAPKTLGYKSLVPQKKAQIKAYYAEALYNKGEPTYELYLKEAWDLLQSIPDSTVDSDIRGKRKDILCLKGDIAIKETQYIKAKYYYNCALDTSLKNNDGNPHKRDYAKILLKLATLYDNTRQYDSALYYSQFALSCVTPVSSTNITMNPQLKDLYTENTIMEALDSKANFLTKKYEHSNDVSLLKNAAICYDLAFTVEQKLLAYFTYDSSRAQMQEVSKGRSEQAIHTCYQLYQLTHNNSWAEKAFQFSENSKALILLEAIKKNIYSSHYRDNILFKIVDSLQLQLAFAERELFTNEKAITVEAANRKKRLENELANAMIALDHSELSYKNYRQQQDTALLTNLKQKLLTENRNLVEFFSMDNEAYLFVVKKSGQLYFTKLDSGVNQEIKKLMGYYTSSDSTDPASFRQAAYHLYQTCRLPEAFPIGELLIIPDGLFNQIPFDALVTSDVDKGFAKMDYLLKKATVSYGYSAASLLKQLSGGYSVNDKIAAFAPVFANNERGLNALQASKMEINSIHPKWPYIGHQATVANFRNSLNHAGIIHIASHAGADTGANANPWVEMYDSAFHMNELYATPLRNTNLVVLSACQTNQGKLDQSEGTLSLARGFYYAGAKNIVASLWKIDDESTADIVQQFYTAGNSNDYAAKLHKAKEQYLSNPKIQAKGKAAPYYWAALMHIGGFRQNTHIPAWFGYSIIAILLLAMSIFYWLSRRS